MNSYASLSDFKGILGITSTTDDVTIRKILENASILIDNYCERRFYVTSETKYLDGAIRLWTPDLLTVTTLKVDFDRDGVFELTYTYLTDYYLYGVGLEDTLNTYPKIRIERNPLSSYVSFGAGYKRAVEIAGTWGYGDGISSNPVLIDTTLSAAITTTTATTCTVTSATNLSAGMTILVDLEQMYISSTSTTTLTIERGVNGTTAATHLNNAQIYFYRYPNDIRQACLDLSVALYQNRGKQGLQSERIGDYSYVMAGTSLNKGMINSLLDDKIFGYRRMRV